MDQIEAIVREVVARLAGGAGNTGSSIKDKKGTIPAEMSARHVHLSREDLKALFGLDELKCAREISQPGQYLSECRVRLIGPKGLLENVAVLGPTRGATQVEISATDARTLGIAAPVRLSGELADAAEVAIQAGSRIVTRKAAIVAKRHLHMTPADAAAYGVKHGESVCVRVLGSRPLVLEDVPVRVSEQAALALHMDTDEANAAGAGKDCRCEIVGPCAGSACSAGACASVTGQSCAPVQASRAPGAPQSMEACRTLAGKLIVERDVKQLAAEGAKALCVGKGQLITPLAKDTAKALGVKVTFGG